MNNLVQILNNAITQYYTSTTSGLAETAELINTLTHLIEEKELTEEEEQTQIQIQPQLTIVEENHTHNAQFAEIQAMMESAIDIEFIKSLKTRNGNTQTSEQIYIEKITDILRENNISFEKAGSQQPYDLRNVGNTGLLIEVKKTSGNTIIFNDTCPSANVYYIVFITKSGKEKMLFIRGDEFIEDSPWIVEYTAEINKIKDKYARGKNKKTGTMQVYPRPNYSAHISKFM